MRHDPWRLPWEVRARSLRRGAPALPSRTSPPMPGARPRSSCSLPRYPRRLANVRSTTISRVSTASKSRSRPQSSKRFQRAGEWIGRKQRSAHRPPGFPARSDRRGSRRRAHPTHRPQQSHPAEPTRAISATPFAGSGTKKMTSAMTAASKRCCSNGNAMASPSRNTHARWPVAFARQRSCPSLGSTPLTSIGSASLGDQRRQRRPFRIQRRAIAGRGEGASQ